MNLEDIKQMTKLEERAEKAEATREKLIEALAGAGGRFEDVVAALKNGFRETALEYAKTGVTGTRAVLAEVKEKE